MKRICGDTPRARLFLACMPIAILFACGAHAGERRISVSIEPTCYVLDSQFFDLGTGFGIDGTLRFELKSDLYFENGLGLIRTEGGGVNVSGLDYRMSIVSLLSVLDPYRAIIRLGLGLLSVNPITVTPTESYRPNQTTIYIIGGAGATRALRDNLRLEVSANVWMTPYRYRIYRFDRLDVETRLERFTHFSVSIGAAYTF